MLLQDSKIVIFLLFYTRNYGFRYVNVSRYRSGTVNSKSFVGKVLLQIKWRFQLTYAL